MGDKDVTIATFASITGSDFGTARFYLEMNEWNLEVRSLLCSRPEGQRIFWHIQANTGSPFPLSEPQRAFMIKEGYVTSVCTCVSEILSPTGGR